MDKLIKESVHEINITDAIINRLPNSIKRGILIAIREEIQSQREGHLEIINELARAAFEGILNFNHFAFKAPVLILIVSERQKAVAEFAGIVKSKNFSLMDIGIAAEHFCLQAAEEGLGTCMLGWFNEKKVKNLLSIPRLKRVELIISVGFSADDNIPHKKRKSVLVLNA